MPIDFAAIAAGGLGAKLWFSRRGRARGPRPRAVAVFDAHQPPAVAFIRSLGAAGVPVTAFSHLRHPAGRYSRHSSAFRSSPDPIDSQGFIAWLVDEMERGAIDLVAPTSDYIAFNASQALQRLGGERRGYAPSANLNDCLFKDRFVAAMDAAGFPTPPTRSPTSLDAAVVDAADLGFPLVLKPRSHIGVGVARGTVVGSERELVRAFVPYALHVGHAEAVAVDPHLRLPLLQSYRAPSSVDVVSVSGVLDQDGSLMALGHSIKTHQWPPRLGIGTRFEAVGPQPFSARAVAAVQRVLGHGMFELEVLVDRVTGEYWAIDLNPRGFGQMSLDVAAGRDLPVFWYNSAVATPVASARRAGGPPPRSWRMGAQFYAGALVRRAQGGRSGAMHRPGREPGAIVGPMWQARDPVPGAIWAWQNVRHPLGLLRPYLSDTEVVTERTVDRSPA